MKKKLLRILAVGLCLCLMVGFVGCDKPADPTDLPAPTGPKYDEATNTWYIATAEQMQLLAEHPDANFVIDAEIDCNGMVWTPVENFTGTLSGVWAGVFNHTISNLVIEGKPGTTAVGLFGTADGTIENLNFENITVKLPEGFSGNAGLIAGTIKKDINNIKGYNITIELSGSNVVAGGVAGRLEAEAKDCYLDGAITGTLADGDNAIGGFAAVTSMDMEVIETKMDMTITAAGKGSIGGIVGIVEDKTVKETNYGGRMNITAGDAEYAVAPMVGTLNGKLQRTYSCAREFNVTGTKLTTGDYYGAMGVDGTIKIFAKRDLTNVLAAENMSEAEKELRQIVLDYMYEMCTIVWSPSYDLYYEDTCSGGKAHTQSYRAGETYFGMPYTHMSGSLERMKYWMNEDGTIREDLPARGQGFSGYSSPFSSWDYYLGNDCADAIFWAWSQISDSISFTLTDNMVLRSGTVMVGEYKTPEFPIKSSDFVSVNGTALYAAYAQLEPGDAVLNGPGHAVMAAGVPYVFYNDNGQIDGTKSYVLCHEQGYLTNSVGERHTTCAVYRKYTFEGLLNGNYIPLTIQELVDGVASTPVVEHTVTGTTIADLLGGTVKSKHRINEVTVTIADTNGNVVTTATVHPTSGNAVHNVQYVLSKIEPDLDLSSIKAGEKYQCTVTVHVGTEDVQVISGEFTG